MKLKLYKKVKFYNKWDVKLSPIAVRPCAIVTSIKWDVKFASSFTTMWSFHCKTKSYVQIGASLLKISRTKDDLQFWVLFKFLCSSSSLKCNIAAIVLVVQCRRGSAVLYCCVVWCCLCGAQFHWVVELVFIFSFISDSSKKNSHYILTETEKKGRENLES